MTRVEIYQTISPCGTIPYASMVYLLEHIAFPNPAMGYLLIQRLSQTGQLSKEDWIVLAKAVNFSDNSPITAATIESWLDNKCSLTRTELKEFLEYVEFGGSIPTYILSQEGDFIISEQ